MSTRYWAPTQPHIDPDPVDLALLKPSGTDRLDLGAALLAMHRVGAAACKVAAATPLVDETTVVQSVAAARAGLADPMINSVSKSVGSENYAALLVRDLFDDAEAGALDLFRHAVAKGVAPPVAADRAGAAFGIPSAAMGRFRALAADPRTNPATLADAADRALLTYVEKVVGEEIREDVSKAPVMDRPASMYATDPDDPTREYYDVRDSRGRFSASAAAAHTTPVQTQTGGGDQRTAVLERPVAEAAPEAPRPMSPAVARLRRQLGMGVSRAPDVVGATPAEMEQQRQDEERKQALEAQQQRAQRARAGRRSRVRRRQVQGERQQTAAPARVQRQVSRRPVTRQVFAQVQRQAEKVPDRPTNMALLERLPETGLDYNKNDINFNFAMPRDGRVNRFINLWNNGPGRLFRLGHLERMAGAPEPINLGANETDETADSYSLAREAGNQLPDSEVEVERVDITPEMLGTKFNEKLREAQQSFADHLGIDIEQVGHAPARDGTGWFLIDNSGQEKMPEVIEWHILGPRSLVLGAGQWALDPNQAFRALTIDEAQERGLETFFVRSEDDQTTDANAKGVLHMINYMVPVDEVEVDRQVHNARVREQGRFQADDNGGVRKQEVGLLEREELRQRARVQPRDRIGRFAEVQTPGVARYTSQLSAPKQVAPPVAAAEEAPADQDHLARQKQRAERARALRQRRIQRRTGTQTRPTAQRKVVRQVSSQAKRAVSQYAKLAQSLPPTDPLPNDDRPPDDFPLMPDGYYRTLSMDEFLDYTHFGTNERDMIARGNPPDVLYIGDKGDVGDIGDQTFVTMGEAPTHSQMRVTYAAQQLEDDNQSPEPIHSWPSTDLNAHLAAAKMARSRVQDTGGLVVTVPEDTAGLRLQHLANRNKARPIILIDFSDERVTGEQPFDLVFDGEDEFTSHTKPEDIAELEAIADIPPGATMAMKMPVWKYTAVPTEADPEEYDNPP